MNFCDYMTAVQSTKLETPEDKLRWIFRMYDKNYSNSIETDELSNMFRTLFDMIGMSVGCTQMEMIVTDVMQTLDDDGNGSLDLNEFVRGSLKTPFIVDILEQSQSQTEQQMMVDLAAAQQKQERQQQEQQQ